MMMNWLKHVSVVVVVVLLTLARNTSGESLIVNDEVTIPAGIYTYDDVLLIPRAPLRLGATSQLSATGLRQPTSG